MRRACVLQPPQRAFIAFTPHSATCTPRTGSHRAISGGSAPELRAVPAQQHPLRCAAPLPGLTQRSTVVPSRRRTPGGPSRYTTFST